jgi:hypothetical protein
MNRSITDDETVEDVLAALNDLITKTGSQTAAAERLGCSSHHINMLVRRKTSPGGPVCARLGFSKQVVARYVATTKRGR